MSEEGTEGAAPETVEKSIYQRVVVAKQGLESKVSEQAEQIAALTEKAATADTLASSVTEWQAKAQQAEGRFTRFKEISGAIGSTDQEAIEAVEWQHSKLPEDGRPAIGDWLTALKEKPTEAPAILRPFFSGDDAGGSGDGGGDGGDAGKKEHRRGAERKQAPGGKSQYSPDEIKRARTEAMRSGDWNKYREMRKTWGAT